MPVEEDPPAGAPEWVVTYGDMMSLLLTFFIMLVSTSELKKDDAKFRAMLNSIHQIFGPDWGKFGAPGASLTNKSLHDKLATLGESQSGGLLKGNAPHSGPGGPNAPVRRVQDGKLITLGGPVMFDRFSAELSPQLKLDLDVLAPVMRKHPQRIEVRGHATAEPVPAGVNCGDAFDLSFARARNVAEYLIGKGVPRHRLRVSAAGDTEPRTISRDQTANRRVDVFLLDSYIEPPRGGKEGQP